MKRIVQILSLAGAVLVLAPCAVRAQSGVETPTYSNAEVVSIDPLRRVMVLKTPQGVTKTLIFDDLLAGTGNAKAGDRVIVTVRGGPGRKRVSAISVMPARPPSPPTVTLLPARQTDVAAVARTRYSDQVAAVSRQADLIDTTWRSFVDSCAVKPAPNESGGRDWFRLWDSSVQADYSGGRCRELFNEIVSAGEDIKRRMATIEDGIEKTMTPGEIRDIRRIHSMNWDGWKLPAPPRREP